jgi:hypothetical protein
MEWYSQCGAEQEAVQQLSRQGLMPHQLLEQRPPMTPGTTQLLRTVLAALAEHDAKVAAWKGSGSGGSGGRAGALQQRRPGTQVPADDPGSQVERVRFVRDTMKGAGASDADLAALWRNLVPEDLEGRAPEGAAGLQQVAHMLVERPVNAGGLLAAQGPFSFEYDHPDGSSSSSNSSMSNGGAGKSAASAVVAGQALRSLLKAQ